MIASPKTLQRFLKRKCGQYRFAKGRYGLVPTIRFDEVQICDEVPFIGHSLLPGLAVMTPFQKWVRLFDNDSAWADFLWCRREPHEVKAELRYDIVRARMAAARKREAEEREYAMLHDLKNMTKLQVQSSGIHSS